MGSKKCWLGVDLGGTKMLAAVYDPDFKLLAEVKEKTKGLEGIKAVVGRLADLVEAALRDAGIKRRQAGGLAVGCPGPVNMERRTVVTAPNLDWHNVPLGKILQKKLGLPALVLNDVDAGTYGEYRFGAGRGAHCVVGVFPGTGIGGGCIYKGRILHGRANTCMEIGHMIVVPDGRLCGCGRHGCLEAHASRLAIAADVAAAVYRGQAPALRKLAGTDLTEIKSRTLTRAIAAGDEAVEDIVRRAARLLGVAVANTVNLLAPDVVVLGGGLVEALEDIYVGETREALAGNAMPLLARGVKVRAARLGDYAGVLGCAALAAETFGRGKSS